MTRMTKGAFHARVWGKLLAHSKRHRLVERDDKILIALSGGPDSVCLADFLRRLSKKVGFEIRLMHLDHGLRGKDSARDRKFAEEFAARLGVPLASKKIAVKKFSASSRRSIEDAARQLRYKALLAQARRAGCRKIATGHQLDDHVETFFLNLLRGTQLKGLAGIPVRRKEGRVEIIRPILCLTRAEVMEYARYFRLPFRIDKTNAETEFTRNWLRKEVLPLLERRSPRLKEHVGAIADAVAGAVARPH